VFGQRPLPPGTVGPSEPSGAIAGPSEPSGAVGAVAATPTHDQESDDTTRESPESNVLDTLSMTVVVECVRLIDAWVDNAEDGTVTLSSSDITNAGDVWVAGSDNELPIVVDYTSNCQEASTNPGGPQKVNLAIGTLPSGLTASVNSVSYGTDTNSLAAVSASTGTSKASDGTALASGATGVDIISGIRNVSATGAGVAVQLAGFAEVATGTDVVLTFTLSDEAATTIVGKVAALR